MKYSTVKTPESHPQPCSITWTQMSRCRVPHRVLSLKPTVSVVRLQIKHCQNEDVLTPNVGHTCKWWMDLHLFTQTHTHTHSCTEHVDWREPQVKQQIFQLYLWATATPAEILQVRDSERIYEWIKYLAKKRGRGFKERISFTLLFPALFPDILTNTPMRACNRYTHLHIQARLSSLFWRQKVNFLIAVPRDHLQSISRLPLCQSSFALLNYSEPWL